MCKFDNKTSIVNVITLMLFTLIRIVYKYGTIDNVYLLYIDLIGKGTVILRVYLWYRDLVVSLALERT